MRRLFTSNKARSPPHKKEDHSLKNEALIAREFLTLGVSLEVLMNLPIDPEDDFQTVCEEIKKRTKETKGNRSLASHLLQDPKTKHLVAKADYFGRCF